MSYGFVALSQGILNLRWKNRPRWIQPSLEQCHVLSSASHRQLKRLFMLLQMQRF